MIGVVFGGGWRAIRFAGPGVVFAVVALVLFALMAITMDVALESADWIQVLVVSRLVIALVSLIAIAGIAIAARRAPDEDGTGAPIPLRRVALLLLVAGALDAS